MLFPPQWTPISPHFAIPSLSAQLKKAGFETKVYDLNIEFYDKILTKNYILDSAEKAIRGQDELIKEISKHHSKGKDFSEYPFDIQNKMVRYSKVKEYITQKPSELIKIAEFADEAKAAIKDKQAFYKPITIIIQRKPLSLPT